VADPRLAEWANDWRQPFDLRLSNESPAIDAGVALPDAWPDPLRDDDRGKPDIGAIAAGIEPWRVGVGGRLTMFGGAAAASARPAFEPMEFPPQPGLDSLPERQPAAIVMGYPAFDADVSQYLLTKLRVRTDVYEREWLDTKHYARYGLVVVMGDLVRAKMSPNKFDDADLARVREFLDNGGTLLLMLRGRHAFDTPAGEKALTSLVGDAPRRQEVSLVLRDADHPWLRHLDPKLDHAWIAPRTASPMRAGKGEAIIGDADGRHATLLSVPVGKGRLIYLGWQITEFLPHGRQSSTVEAERLFEEQVQLLENILRGQ